MAVSMGTADRVRTETRQAALAASPEYNINTAFVDRTTVTDRNRNGRRSADRVVSPKTGSAYDGDLLHDYSYNSVCLCERCVASKGGWQQLLQHGRRPRDPLWSLTELLTSLLCID